MDRVGGFFYIVHLQYIQFGCTSVTSVHFLLLVDD